MIIRNPLTVKELMERLEKADPALPVYIETDEGYQREARYAGKNELNMSNEYDEPIRKTSHKGRRRTGGQAWKVCIRARFRA